MNNYDLQRIVKSPIPLSNSNSTFQLKHPNTQILKHRMRMFRRGFSFSVCATKPRQQPGNNRVMIATVVFSAPGASPHGRTPFRGISVADQPAINLSTFFHLSSTRSTCSSATEALAKVATRPKLLVHLAEFATIIPNES